MTFARVSSGGLVDLAAPNASDFTMRDIAVGLARIPRFLGQTRRPISVLEHSLVVGDLVSPSQRLAALLHDAGEALIGDITRPARAALAAQIGPAFVEGLAAVERRALVAAIARALRESGAAFAHGAEVEAEALADECDAGAVRIADDAALRMEMAFGFEGRVQPRYLERAPDEAAFVDLWLTLVAALARARAARPGDAA